MLNESIRNELINMDPHDITKEFIDNRLSKRYDIQQKKILQPEISPQEEFILKKGECYTDKDIKTNVGQLVINKVIYQRNPKIANVVGYVAEPFTKGTIEKIENKMSAASNEGKLEVRDWADYLDAIQWLGNTVNTNVAPSFTPNTIKVLPKVKKRRDELFKLHKKELDENNTTVALEISNELVKLAKEELKNDVGMELYDSQAKPKFGNNYKNCFISRTTVDMPHKEIIETANSSFMEGIEKKDIPQYGTAVVNGSYAKGVDTGVAGYVTKKFFATYQNVTLDVKGSDCKTKGYRVVKITKQNKDKLKNRYIIEGNNLIELTVEKIDSYIGKTVKLRSPMYCIGKKLCNKCAGNSFYNQGIKNIGLATSSIGSCFLNFLMKAFHDSSLKLVEVDVNDLIIE